MNDWIIPDWPAPAGVRALITTRSGGVSRGAYATMNLATHVGDDPPAVVENRRTLAARLPADPVWLTQVHGRGIVCADDAAPGVEADGAYSMRPGVVCAVLTADCLPVLLCDAAGTAVAAVHAGWRGLAGGVIEAAVAAMHAAPENLLAYLGPAIGAQAFEVGADVREAFGASSTSAAHAFAAKANGKWNADLYLLARRRLEASGVARVFGGGFCTYSEAGRFFSFRREQVTGRIASLVWLEGA